MPTNKERREIAEYLRNMCIYGCSYKEEFYDLLVDNVMDELYDPEFSDVADRLAELIEPEERTCHNISTVPCKFTCSECHQSWREAKGNGAFAYCPNCGAKVIQE